MTIYTKVLIIGAGFAGLGMGIKLLHSGRENFVILERRPDVGGAWYDNNYPGIACDVPSHFYSFSFITKPDWSRIFSPGGEIQQYMRKCAEDEGLIPYIKFNSDMVESRWNAEKEHWVIKTQDETYVCKILITGTGHLADSHTPNIEGLDTFTGDFFHSAEWDHSIDLKGKRIGVVGSGASAIQIVPEMQKIASELVVFQRSAPYMNLRNDHIFTDAEKRTFERNPDVLDHFRSHVFWFGESQFSQRRLIPQFFDEAMKVALGHMESQVSDPELRKKLTPNYALGCKRRLSSSAYYPAVSSKNTTVEATALTRVEGNMAYGSSGEGYEVDALIFATGFEAVRPPFAKRIFDGEGLSLDEHWEKGMQGYDSVAVAGYPNLFLINGPNTGLGHNSTVYMIEAQVEYILGALTHFEEHKTTVIEVKREAEDEYMDHLQALATGSVWLDGGCKSWYVDDRSGRLTLIWPDFAHSFREENGTFNPEGYTSTAIAVG